METGAGYRNVHEFSDLSAFADEIGGVLANEGPTFVVLKVVLGAESPRDYGQLYAAAKRVAFRNAVSAPSVQ
jgi:hypothetical protein